MSTEAFAVLQHEDIRLCDGRYSNGFVDTEELKALVRYHMGVLYDREGMIFVRITEKYRGKEGVENE